MSDRGNGTLGVPPDIGAELRRLRVALAWCRQFVPYATERPLPGWIVRGTERVDAELVGVEADPAFDAEWADA